MRILAIFLVFISNAVYGNDDPLADHNVTCDEMDKFPEIVFKLDDLGSGHGSPNQVDYRCPKSLSQLDFLAPTLSKAGSIRSPSQLPQYCTGSIIHAQWRYYHFDLAKLGYYPKGFSLKGGKTKGLEYFEEWSYQSLHNREIYKDYMSELEKVRPLLIQWYEQNHFVETETAKKYADLALSRISSFGFGSYYYYWKPEELVPYTNEAIDGNYKQFLSSLNEATDIQKLNSLRRTLLHSLPEDVIKELVNSISKTSSKERSESPISIAILSPSYVTLLIKAGFDPNHQNIFGKTPLYYAIQFNQHESARRLIEAGAEVNHKYQLEKENKWSCIGISQWDRTPLMHASQHSDVSMIKLLLANKANPLLKDSLGYTAVDYAKNNDNEGNANYLISEIEKIHLTRQASGAP